MNWADYIRAPRPLLAAFFFEVIFGALYALNFNVFALDLQKLLIIFASFQSLYYAIYLINDVIDYESDRLSPQKQKRPIAGGRISRVNALVYALILAIIAFAISLSFLPILAAFEAVFLVYSWIYSFVLKKIPYVDSFAGGFTHALRFAMGIALFGAFTQYYFIIAILFITSAYTFVKRLKEMKYREDVKHPVKQYSLEKIKIIWAAYGIVILALLLLATGMEQMLIGLILLIYVVSLAVYLKNDKIEDLFNSASNY